MTFSTHRVIGIIFILLICIVPAWAGNSIFSFQGFPTHYYGNDIYGFGMGDTGMADTYRLNTGFGNPALISRTRNAVFSTSVLFGYTWYQDNSGAKYKDNSLDFPYFNLVVPINVHKLGFQFQSLSSGVVKDQRYVNDPADSTDIPFTEFNTVDSYLYRIDLMYSYPFKYFDFGVALNYYFGHEVRSISQDSGNSPFNTFYSLNRSYDNAGMTLGIIKKTEKISTAVTYTSAAKLTGDTIFKNIQSTETREVAHYNLPNSFGVGLTLNHSDRVRTSYDMHYDMWKNADNPENTEDSWKVGAGVTYEASASADKFLRKIPYRAGISWRRLPFLKNNTTIDEKGASFGFSLPLKDPENRIDLGIQYLIRGDKSKNQVQESSLMMMIGITGFDIFTREHRRTAPREIPKVEEMQ
jgi:hypothetical protein